MALLANALYEQISIGQRRDVTHSLKYPPPSAAHAWQAPKVETLPGASTTEACEIAKEKARLRGLEREYWNVVDGGVEEALVRQAFAFVVAFDW